MSNHDAYTRICDNQSLTVLPIAGLFALSGSIDLLSNGTSPRIAGRDVGPGAPVPFRLHVTETADAGFVSLAISYVFSSDVFDAASTGTTAVLIPIRTIVSGELVKGREFEIEAPVIPVETIGTGRRYIGLLFAPSSTPAAGRVSAWVSLGGTPGRARSYAKNYSGPA